MAVRTDEPPPVVDGWSEDALLGGRLRLRQPRRGYRVAIDTLLLAAAVPAGAGSRLIELGAGVGAAALAVAHRLPAVEVLALERDPTLAAVLALNARANGLAHRVRAVASDVRRPPLAPRMADVVFLNPPYVAPTQGTAPATALGLQARREHEPSLAGWLAAAEALLRPGGEVVVVHRADRLGELLGHFAGRPCQVLPLWPRAGRAARRVLLRARVARRGGVRLGAGLVLHDTEGHFTPAARAILRDGAALGWE